MKRVLVPLDGTGAAQTVFPFVEKVCSPGDQIVLLAVIKPEDPQVIGSRPGRRVRGGFAGPSGGVSGLVTPDVPVFDETKDEAQARQIDEARTYLQGPATALREAGFEVETEVVLADRPAEAIVQHALKMQPSFIAMTPRTHFSVNEMLFGSIATQVMRSGVAPVLFAPAPANVESEPPAN